MNNRTFLPVVTSPLNFRARTLNNIDKIREWITPTAIKTFSDLQIQYGIPASVMFCYLQIKHYIKKLYNSQWLSPRSPPLMASTQTFETSPFETRFLVTTTLRITRNPTLSFSHWRPWLISYRIPCLPYPSCSPVLRSEGSGPKGPYRQELPSLGTIS